MEVSARSYLTAGVSFTAATAIALSPLVIQENQPAVTVPHVTVSDLRLTVTPADIEVVVADLQAVLDDVAAGGAEVAGIPGQTLIGVADGIATLFDVGFSGLIDATDNPTLAASLTILKTLSVDAYLKLAENLGRINPVITGTTSQVGELLSTALTGSLQNMLIALANVADDPLSPASYTGLLTAGVASGQLLAGNSLQAIQSLGDAGFAIAGIAVDEVTFQFNNAVSGLSALATQLSEASGSAVVEAAVETVQDVAVAPAVAVVNLGSETASTALTTANDGFDAVLETATDIVDGDAAVDTMSLARSTEEPTAPSDEFVAVFDESDDDADAGKPAADDETTGDEVTDDGVTGDEDQSEAGDASGEEESGDDDTPGNQAGDDGNEGSEGATAAED